MKPLALPGTHGTLATTAGEVSQDKLATKPEKERALKAAREFESLLLRHMLESMQKTAHIGKSDSKANDGYQSMAVEALADGVERGGGLGLADLIAHTLESEISSKSR
ncbi:MAG TPA: rod-binding protein [Polyangiaceae bacterium]|nr:rod-binding protein [Polyangiaceae bacterium]